MRLVLGIAVVAALSVGVWSFYERPCSEISAYSAVQSELGNFLKSPSSAVYPGAFAVSDRNDLFCKFTIKGHFDSANSYGAMMRGTYTAHLIQREDRSWHVWISEINGKTP